MKTEFYFEKLDVWQISMEFIEKVYKLTKRFPEDEKYGLISQMRRAAISIATNIAEGKGRYYTKEFIQFLYIARGSVYEIITLTKVSLQLNYLGQKDSGVMLETAQVILSKLNGLINSMK